ncbi:MAG TPA: hypothetical protein VNA20_13115 [Frankiaceae bacterium]|nr:hypothetical protein [Frankiaceae bacterium]
MPDLDPLPRRPRPPVLAPRTGDYPGVVRRARRRRARQAGAAGAGVTSVLAVVLLAGGSGAGTFGLDPLPPAASVPGEPATTSSPGESPAPDPTAAPAEEHPEEPAGTASPEPEPEPEPEPSGVAAEPEPTEPAGEEPQRDPHRPAPSRPVLARDEVGYDSIAGCAASPFLAESGWCVVYQGHDEVAVGRSYEYRLLACRPTGRGAGTVRFDTEQQVELAVAAGNGRVEWTWSRGYEFPRAEVTVGVPEGRCGRWTVTWDVTRTDGDPLRAGTYWISPSLLVTDWGDGQAWAHGSSEQFRVVDQ